MEGKFFQMLRLSVFLIMRHAMKWVREWICLCADLNFYKPWWLAQGLFSWLQVVTSFEIAAPFWKHLGEIKWATLLKDIIQDITFPKALLYTFGHSSAYPINYIYNPGTLSFSHLSLLQMHSHMKTWTNVLGSDGWCNRQFCKIFHERTGECREQKLSSLWIVCGS